MNRKFFLAALAVVAGGFARADQVPLTGIVQLSARGDHACVVTASGGAKCWGSNSAGQLGAGPMGYGLYRTAARDVTGLTSGVVAIASAAGEHTCAIVTGGGVKCWGANFYGELGDGTKTIRAAPVDVQGLPFQAVALSAGYAHTCALSAAGAVACWGMNGYGQLGDGTTTERLNPVLVAGLPSGVVQISAGVYHTCAITDTGALKCWGANIGGALGDGTFQSRSTPTDVVGLGSGVTDVATGGDVASPPKTVSQAYSCAVASGVTKCWGSTGNFTGNNTPIDVPAAGVGASDVSIGGGFVFDSFGNGRTITQFCVLTVAGGVRCWGVNYCGKVGDGTTPVCSASAPTVPPAIDVVGLPASVVSVSAGFFFTCALVADGTVECWGSGYGSTAAPAMEGTTPQAIVFSQTQPFVAIGGTAQVAVYPGPSSSPLILASVTPATCSVSGTMVTGVAAGTCTLTGNQAGDTYYDPAPEASVSFPIDPHTAQNITFSPAPSSLVVGGVGSVAATSSSGRLVTIEVQSQSACAMAGAYPIGYPSYPAPGQVVNGIATGTCTVHGYVLGDSTYARGDAYLQIPVGANTGTQALVAYTWGGGSGTVTSSPAGIDCGLACAANYATGSTVTLTANVPPGSIFDGWSGPCSGIGDCIVTMDAAKTVSARFDSEATRLSNISTRGLMSFGNDVLIGGFVIGGTENKTVLLRARGASLRPFISSGVVVDPMIRLIRMSDQAVIAVDTQSEFNREEIIALGLGVDLVHNESAMLITLAPGAYTANTQPGQGPGLGIFEVFEIDRADQPLINISTRGQVGTDEGIMIAGFIIEGSGEQTVAVRAIGPSLANYGVPNPLADPTIELVRQSDHATLAINDNWKDAANASDLAASGFAPSNDLESAILIKLPPGAYTAVMKGARGTTGNGVVEVYRVSN